MPEKHRTIQRNKHRFIRRIGDYLYILQEPIKDSLFVRIDTDPMPFTDMKNYIDTMISKTREYNDIDITIVNAEDNDKCPCCGASGVDGGLFIHDTRENTVAITNQACNGCLLNFYFLFKHMTTIEKDMNQ